VKRRRELESDGTQKGSGLPSVDKLLLSGERHSTFYESGRLVNHFFLCASSFFPRASPFRAGGGYGPDVPNFYPLLGPGARRSGRSGGA
jgi:hypothetical protein